MTPSVANLVARLEDADAKLISSTEGDAFSEVTYEARGVIFRLLSEYGIWRANIGIVEAASFPASFWLAALKGTDDVPMPAVTDEDLERLGASLPELLQRASELSSRVARMGDAYERAMRERFA